LAQFDCHGSGHATAILNHAFSDGPASRIFTIFFSYSNGNLADDHQVDRLVKLCLSRQDIPGLAGAMWKFKGVAAVDDPRLEQQLTTADQRV
jgi:hypothetical protein